MPARSPKAPSLSGKRLPVVDRETGQLLRRVAKAAVMLTRAHRRDSGAG